MTDRGAVIDVGGGYVRLIDWMGDDLSVVNAARASFAKESKTMRAADARLIDYLASHGHHSPFRHAVLSLEVRAPLMVARQWFKYRIGSVHSPDTAEVIGIAAMAAGQGDDGGDGWGDLLHARNEASRRYITLEPEFYIPTPHEWRSRPDNAKQGSGSVVDADTGAESTARMEMIVAAGMAAYHWALAAGIAPEQARLFLPAYAMQTVWRWTASVEAVAHFLRQRLGHDAQDEIRRYAEAVRDLVQPLFPVTLERLLRDHAS